jgi:cell wall-active antibiotic response 4TMS protein YvqF
MASGPTNQPPSPGPPAAPGPGASRDEWHDYRHRMRDFMRSQRWSGYRYGGSGGELFLAVALVVLGAYFLLRNLGLISWFKEDILWPAVLIALGLLLLLRQGTWWR